MRVSLVSGLAALLLVAGCGNKAKTPKATNHAPTVTNKTSITGSNASDCATKGITSGAYREGVCVSRGVTITVANKAHRVDAGEYDARLVHVRTAKTLQTRSGKTLRAEGEFAIVTLSITNRLATPHAFDQNSDLVLLIVDKKLFTESPAAETNTALNPFRLQDAIQPDATAVGTVVFDLPSEHVRNLSASGSDLLFVDFSDEGKGPASGKTPQKLGYIRLWK